MAVGDAIREIARRGEVDVTLDASLPAIGERITLAGGRRSVAEALLFVADGRALEIDVGADGGLIVVAAPGSDPRGGSVRSATADSVRRAVRLSRIVVSATPDREGLFGATPLVGMQTIGVRELRLAPGFFGTDVLRNARLLPGLSARNDYSTALNVRGGESDQSIVTLDGIPLYHPFHLGGLLSSFIEPAVSQMDMFTGVFPARYGGHLSGVLDVRSAEEPRSGVHGTADLNLLYSSAALGGTTRGGSTSWLIAGRRTYADAVAALIGQSLPYHFEDANLHLSHRFGGGSRVELTAYADQDVIDSRSGSDTTQVSAGNRAVGVSWSREVQHLPAVLTLFGESAAVQQRASITAYDASADPHYADLALSSGVRDMRIAGALSVFDSTTRHTLGYELARQRIDRAVALSSIPEARNFSPDGRSTGELRSAALWYEARRQVTSGAQRRRRLTGRRRRGDRWRAALTTRIGEAGTRPEYHRDGGGWAPCAVDALDAARGGARPSARLLDRERQCAPALARVGVHARSRAPPRRIARSARRAVPQAALGSRRTRCVAGYAQHRRCDRDRAWTIERCGDPRASSGAQRLRRLALVLVLDIASHGRRGVLVRAGAGPATRAESRR